MTCINVREGEAVVTIIDLDGCGTPEVGASGMIQTSNIIELGWEDSVTAGDTIRRTNLGGRVCYTSTGKSSLDFVTVNLTSCGINPVLDSKLLGSALKLAGEVVRGYARRDLSSIQNAAIEVLMQLDTDACDGGGDAPVLGILWPLTKDWATSGGSTLNGSDPVEPAFTGKAYKNPLIFGDEGDTIVSQLAKWESVADFDPVNDWYSVYLFDAADAPLPEASCDPVELALAAS